MMMTTTLELKSSPVIQSEPPCQNCEWSPRTGEMWPSFGKKAVKWIQKFLICAEGDFFGKPFRLRTDQKLFLYKWYEFCPICGFWRYDRALRMAATGDGKTSFFAAIICLEFAGPPEIAPTSPNIPVAAASFDQADLIFKNVSVMLGGMNNEIKESPLCGLFAIYDTEIKFADGKPGRIFRTAAIAGTNEGGLPTLFVCDEVHEWGELGASKARRHTVISKSTAKRNTQRGPGRVLNISTAGFDVNTSMLGHMYKHALRVIHDAFFDPTFLADIHEAPEGLNYELPEHREIAVRAASDAADILWSVKKRVAAWNDPLMERHEWIRYFANRWVGIAEDSWLKDHPGAWEKCSGKWDSDPTNEFVISIDMALKHDSCAVNRIEHLPDGRYAVSTRIWRAQEHDGRIPHDDVWRYIREASKGQGFKWVVYDPRYFEVPAALLEADGIACLEFDQSPQRLAPACGLAFDYIINQTFVHNGDPDLARHVNSAVSVPQERGGFTLKKGKSKTHIDACVAMCMGIFALVAIHAEEEAKIHLEGSLMA